MGEVERAGNSNLFFNPDTGRVAGFEDETGCHLLTDSTGLPNVGGGNPDAYKEFSFLEQGKYARLNLLSGGENNNAVGGANELTAKSSPAELLKDSRVRAMLDTIAFAEGTKGNGDYKRVVYGRVVGPANPDLPYDHSLVGKKNVLVSDLRQYPNLLVQVNDRLKSSAAGRYQFLSSTWKGLNMPDFSARSQDLAAVKLMQRRGMIEPLLRGDFAGAIHKGAGEWASLPNADGNSQYNQGVKKLSDLRQVYTTAFNHYEKTADDKTPPKTQPNRTFEKPPVSHRFTARPGTYGSRGKTDIDAIVLHHTAGSNASGANEGMQSRGLSVHYIVDKDGTIYQMVGDEKRAFHAGTGTGKWSNVNSRSIGIEIVNLGNGRDKYTEAQYRALEKLVPYLTHKYNIPVANIVGHSQIGNRNRPAERPEPSTNFDWNRIRQSVSGDTNAPTNPKPTENPKPDNNPKPNAPHVVAPTAFLRRHMRSEQVEQLQNALVKLGYMTAAERKTGPGIFGPRTERAVRKFQSEHSDVNGRRLAVDGLYGPLTRGALVKALQKAETKPTQNPPKPDAPNKPPQNQNAPSYERWNVYSTGKRPARLADGYEDLQAHHDYQSVGYVMHGLQLRHRLEARDVVLTRVGESNFGQRIPSPISGKVLYAGNEGDGYGNKVVVKNEKTGQIVMLGHMESLNVRRGDSVSYGQTVGEQGSTGNSTGAHVHINADPSIIKRWVADLADGKFDGVRTRFDVGRRP